MLIFNFRKERAGNETILRPRLQVRIKTQTNSIDCSALLDSGADTTIIPDYIANLLNLKRENKIKTLGIGGYIEGYESYADIELTDVYNQTEKIIQLPVYILPGINTVVIGRKKVFDNYKITFEQNKITLEKIKRPTL